MGTIMQGDNLDLLKTLENESINLIYIDPPFNTRKTRTQQRIKTEHDEENGDRVGYQGKKYTVTERTAAISFKDTFDDYIGFLYPRLEEAYRILKPNGSLFFHIDYREVHYCKIALDQIFGRDSFMNEIIWAYDYGARSTKKWSAKHDNILWYAKNPKDYTFNFDEMDRIPYMAPGLVSEEKAAKGKTPTDTWWHTIVSPNGKERTGYPTQKPQGVMERIIKVHSNPEDLVLDFFAGSGSTGHVAALLNRDYIMIDNNPQAIQVMKERLEVFNPKINT